MDWIEEIVQKFKSKIKNSSLVRSMFSTIVLFIAGAFVANVMTRNICYGWIKVILERYTDTKEFFNMNLFTQIPHVSFHVQLEIFLLKIVYHWGLNIYVLIAGYMGIKYFFKSRFLPGIDALENAADYLAMGDYSHEPSYHNKDEIGKIHHKIDILRKKLTNEKHQEWDAQIEQSSINSAFAHDIRTPLTVMKGYTEFLLKYIPQGKVSEEVLLEKLEIIYKHQERLLKFSTTMTDIQNLEMRLLHCNWIMLTHLIEAIKRTSKELENQSGVVIQVYQTETEEKKFEKMKISVDEDLIMEVSENLLTNALRYAINLIEVQIMFEDNRLIVFIKDDGEGFSARALKTAKNLYYSEEKGKSNHFGMGLYICEKLCEKHGGRLTIANRINGGGISAAEFYTICKID